MNSALYIGTISHDRFIPKVHSFQYPFYMWYLDLDELDELSQFGRWFSTQRWALSQFRRSDYLGDPSTTLLESVRTRMAELTGHKVKGKIFALLNLRTMGLYFSPVNFYYGFDESNQLSHLLAEVSNIPWNERHHYGHYLASTKGKSNHPKVFHVSPFNPTDQRYQWNIGKPGDFLHINLGVHDTRGHIFEARLALEKQELTTSNIRKQILKKPILTAFIVAGIYWQAMKIYLKGIPYIPYVKERT